MNTKVVIFGLSTEGYELACKIAINGGDVQIIDESTPSAITINSDVLPLQVGLELKSPSEKSSVT